MVYIKYTSGVTTDQIKFEKLFTKNNMIFDESRNISLKICMWRTLHECLQHLFCYENHG